MITEFITLILIKCVLIVTANIQNLSFIIYIGTAVGKVKERLAVRFIIKLGEVSAVVTAVGLVLLVCSPATELSLEPILTAVLVVTASFALVTCLIYQARPMQIYSLMVLFLWYILCTTTINYI